MNEQLVNAKRRKEEMERLRESLENIGERIKMLYKDITDTEIIDAFESCNDALDENIYNHVLDLQDFYFSLDEPLSPTHKIQLINIAENTVQDLLRLIQLESDERKYEAEMEYIEEQGYSVNKLYRINYSDRYRPDEIWLITEFRVTSDGHIYPVHGCKIKNNGEPYKKAQYIPTGSPGSYSLSVG